MRQSSFRSRKAAAAAASETGFVSVTGYRLYGLDGVNRVASGEWFEADDDETAIEVATKMMDGHDCELWAGRRLVARIPHRRENPPEQQ
jgi:cobalamin biosynthesis protein CbiG